MVDLERMVNSEWYYGPTAYNRPPQAEPLLSLPGLGLSPPDGATMNSGLGTS